MKFTRVGFFAVILCSSSLAHAEMRHSTAVCDVGHGNKITLDMNTDFDPTAGVQKVGGVKGMKPWNNTKASLGGIEGGDGVGVQGI